MLWWWIIFGFLFCWKNKQLKVKYILIIDTLPDGWITHVVPLKRRKKVVQSPRQSIQAYASACSFGFRYPGTRSVPTTSTPGTTLPLHRALSANGVKCSLRGLPHSCQLENRVDASYCRRLIHSFFSVCFLPFLSGFLWFFYIVEYQMHLSSWGYLCTVVFKVLVLRSWCIQYFSVHIIGTTFRACLYRL